MVNDGVDTAWKVTVLVRAFEATHLGGCCGGPYRTLREDSAGGLCLLRPTPFQRLLRGPLGLLLLLAHLTQSLEVWVILPLQVAHQHRFAVVRGDLRGEALFVCASVQ